MKKILNANQLKQFDTPDTLLVVSPYPKKGETYSAGASGIASYTKNLVINMDRPVVVLADYATKPTTYREKNTLVTRCFQHDLKLWNNVFKIITQFKKAKQVLIQFDFSLYGSVTTSSLIVPFIALLKLKGYEVTITLHSVVTDVNGISGHLGLTNSFAHKMKAKVMNRIFRTFYKTVGALCDNVVILEQALRQRLEKQVPGKKITVVSHPVDSSLKPIAKSVARKKLGIGEDEQVVLFFGYVNWFKGADFFAKAFAKKSKILGKQARFVIAGGESITLKDQHYYQEYFKSTTQTINTSTAVEITGYVPQEKIPYYFSAADLVVFPYRYFMCASGVLSLVFSYHTPFVVSTAMTDMFKSPDFKKALKSSNLSTKDLVFSLTEKSLNTIVDGVLKNGRKKKLMTMGDSMRSARTYPAAAKQYERVIFERNYVDAVLNQVQLKYA
jgi:glycosyltransferase involved in cell wall biosynthesis